MAAVGVSNSLKHIGGQIETSDPDLLEPEQAGEENLPATRLCPHCLQEHPAGILICPQTSETMAVEPALLPVELVHANYSSRPQKNRWVALGLEILPGLFGILGIGWMYSGRTWIGVAWLVGYLIWQGIVIAFAIWSGLLASFCAGLFGLLWLVISAYNLNSYLRSEPLVFGE